MKKYGFSIIGAVFAMASILLAWKEYPAIAATAGLLAWAFSMAGVKTGSTKWKSVQLFIVCGVFGYVLSPPGGMYLMVPALIFAAAVGSFRILVFEQLAYVRIKWIEPVFYLLAMSLYVSANLLDSTGWVGWAMPALTLFFTTFMILGIITERRDIAATAIDRYGVEIGRPAPGFSLPDEEGKNVSLDEFRNKRHVLLIFVRGDWCPTCHIMLRSYERNKERFAAKNIMLLAIGPDNVGVNKEMVDKLGLDYKLLSDDKMEAVRAYGMQKHSNHPMTKCADGIPLPASFLVDISGNILYTSNPQIAGEILNPETIIPIVEKLHAA